MFVHRLNKVTDQIKKECQGYRYVNDYLIHAISIWCNQLRLNQEIPGITDYILQGYKSYQISEITNHVYDQWQPKQEEQRDFFGRTQIISKKSKLYDLSTKLLTQIHIKNETMIIITLIAFFITAIGYFIYKLNQQEGQASTLVEDYKQHSFNAPSPVSQRITKHFLVLVISASQADFIYALKNKGVIETHDGENLYKLTKYLWIGSESDINQKSNKIKNYLVSLGKESEYDINLVYIELKHSEEGFKPNINQLDRYDAFRKLPDLVVNFTISDRLQMEAYENFEVYTR